MADAVPCLSSKYFSRITVEARSSRREARRAPRWRCMLSPKDVGRKDSLLKMHSNADLKNVPKLPL